MTCFLTLRMLNQLTKCGCYISRFWKGLWWCWSWDDMSHTTETRYYWENEREVAWLLKRQKSGRSIQTIFSTETLVESGVPQGTLLGPLLIMMALSDVTRYTYIFIYDTKADQAVKKLFGANLQHKNQAAIFQWVEDNNMQFYAGKFEILRYHLISAQKSQKRYFEAKGVAILQLLCMILRLI